MDNGSYDIACETCKRTFEADPRYRYCPFCGEKINPLNGKRST